MTRLSHPILALALVFCLVLTGQSMALTRGAAAATGQMVLCTGAGAVTVYFDAHGKPTAAPHVCPDCAFAGLNAVVADYVGAVSFYGSATRISADTPAKTQKIIRSRLYQSRAPPLSV